MNINYSCERCGKEFTQKSHYDSHKQRKKICENNVDKMQKMIDKEAINDLNLKNIKKIIINNQYTNLQEIISLDTFKDLYEFLQIYENDNILCWLNEPWQGKDKQESLLRLFASLGLIEKLLDS